MPTQPVLVVGGGGLGREVIATVRACLELELVGVVDDGQPDVAALARLGTTHLGGLDVLGDLPRGTRFVVAVGSPDARLHLVEAVREAGLEPVTVVHPSATVGGDVRVGEGAVLMAGVATTANVTIGDQCILNVGVLVSHDSIIGEATTVNPGAVIADDVVVGARSFVGSACLVPRGSRVPEGTMIEPGSCWAPKPG